MELDGKGEVPTAAYVRRAETVLDAWLKTLFDGNGEAHTAANANGNGSCCVTQNRICQKR